MTNPFDQFDSISAVTSNVSAPKGTAADNPFDQFSGGGLDVDIEEQQVIGETNSLRSQTPESFGLTKIPSDLGKGLVALFASTPQMVGATIVEVGESAEQVNKEFPDKTAPDTFGRSLLKRMLKDSEGGGSSGIFQMTYNLLAAETDAVLKATLNPEAAKKATKAGYNLVESNKRSLQRMGLIPEGETSVAYDIGQGLGSIVVSVGSAVVTKSPAIAVGFMGWLTNGADYLECRATGKGSKECTTIAATSATGQAGFELIGTKYFLGAGKASSFIKRTFNRILGQSVEEQAQSAFEQGVKQVSGVRNVTLAEAAHEMMYQGMIGAIAGAPVAAVMSSAESHGKSRGMPKETAKEIALKIGENYAELQDAGIALVDKETSGLAKDQSLVEESIKAADEVIQNREAQLAEEGEFEIAKQDAATQEVLSEVNNVVAKFDNTTENIRSVVQASENIDPEIKKLISNKIDEIEGSKGAFSERAQDPSVNISDDLDLVDNSITEIGAFLQDSGVGVESLSGIKDAQRELRQAALQAGNRISSVAREVATPPALSEQQTRERDYERVSQDPKKGFIKEYREDAKERSQERGGIFSDTLTPVSTRLGKINNKLKVAVRRYLFDSGLHLTKDKNDIKPFVESLQNMEEGDYRVLDLALKNKDQEKVDELLSKYNMSEDFANVRETLNEIFDEAREVGIDVNYTEDYFPRQVRRNKVNEYLAVLRGREDWSQIQAALDEVDPNKEFTNEEKAGFINTYLRGFISNRILLSASGFTKERTVDYVTPELNQYYEPSPNALINYVDGMRYGIEARRLFGKDKAEGSIGAYVSNLVDQGAIDSKNEEDVKKILRSVVDQQGTKGAVTWAKNAAYIATMGSPVSAATQVGDLAFSIIENGYYYSFKALSKAVVRKSKFTKEDLGIEHVLQEFEGEDKSAKAVRWVFKRVGLEYMDNLGKETFINAALSRLQKQAKGNNPEYQAYMEGIFGEETGQVTKDLLDGIASENVKFLLFSELSDYQPISLAEMPLNYLRSGNGRIVYMLKSYTLKLLDVHRRKWIDEITSRDPVRVKRGFQNLTKLAIAMLLMGATKDVIKDLMLGRDFEVEDLFIENVIQMAGISRYQVLKSRQQGIWNTFWQFFIPPVGTVTDDLYRDLTAIGLSDKKLRDARTAKDVPVVGKLYYWWFGGGATKKKKKSKSRKRSTL